MKRHIEAAAKYRAKLKHFGGFVWFRNRRDPEPIGWGADLPQPAHVADRTVFVSHDGECFEASQGDPHPGCYSIDQINPE